MSKDPYYADSEWERRLHSAIDKTEVLKMLCGTVVEGYADGQEPEIENPVTFWGGLREIVQGIQNDLIAVQTWEEPEEKPRAEAGE